MKDIVLHDAYDRPVNMRQLQYDQRTTIDEVTSAFLRGLNLDDQRTAHSVTEDTAYMRQTWVYACVTAIARLIASIPITIQNRETGEPIKSTHPIAELFRRPAPRKSAYDFKFTLSAHYELSGNSLWLPGGGRRNLDETGAWPLVPMNPRWVEPVIHSKTGVLLGYKYQPTEAAPPRLYTPDQVLHFKNFNPDSEHWGMSPITPAMHAVRTDVKAAAYNEKFFENSAQPGGMLLHKKPLSRVQRDQVQTQFEEEYGGLNQSHRTAVLAGDWTYQQVGLGQADMEYLEQRRFSREQIAAVYGVPGLLINDPNNSNYSTASVEMRLFADANWLPKVRYIEDVLDAQFFARFAPELTAVFETREAPGLREAISEQIDQAIELNKAGVPLAELIKSFRLPFEEHPWQTKWWIPISMVPADIAAASGLQQIKDDKTILNEKKGEKKGGKVVPFKKKEEEAPKAASAEVAEQRDRYADSYRVMLATMAAQAERKISRYCFELRARECPLDEANEVAEFQRLLAPVVGDVLERGGASVFGELGVDVEFALDKHIRGEEYAVLVEALSHIPSAIVQAVNSDPDSMKRILSAVGNKSKALAHMEVAHVFNAGRLAAMVARGVKKHQWIASRMKGSCNHMNDGEIRAIGSDFSNGMVYPAQFSSERCACLTLPVV